MKYNIQCQINSDNEFVNVMVEASSRLQAYLIAQDQVRSEIGKNPKVKGCVITDSQEIVE